MCAGLYICGLPSQMQLGLRCEQGSGAQWSSWGCLPLSLPTRQCAGPAPEQHSLAQRQVQGLQIPCRWLLRQAERNIDLPE